MVYKQESRWKNKSCRHLINFVVVKLKLFRKIIFLLLIRIYLRLFKFLIRKRLCFPTLKFIHKKRRILSIATCCTITIWVKYATVTFKTGLDFKTFKLRFQICQNIYLKLKCTEYIIKIYASTPNDPCFHPKICASFWPGSVLKSSPSTALVFISKVSTVCIVNTTTC